MNKFLVLLFLSGCLAPVESDVDAGEVSRYSECLNVCNALDDAALLRAPEPAEYIVTACVSVCEGTP